MIVELQEQGRWTLPPCGMHIYKTSPSSGTKKRQVWAPTSRVKRRWSGEQDSDTVLVERRFWFFQEPLVPFLPPLVLRTIKTPPQWPSDTGSTSCSNWAALHSNIWHSNVKSGTSLLVDCACFHSCCKISYKDTHTQLSSVGMLDFRLISVSILRFQEVGSH